MGWVGVGVRVRVRVRARLGSCSRPYHAANCIVRWRVRMVPWRG